MPKLSIFFLRFKYPFQILICLCFFSGCAAIFSPIDTIKGSDIQNLFKENRDGKSKIVDYKIEECLDRVLFILDDMDAGILKVNPLRDKQFQKGEASSQAVQRECSILALVYKGDINSADVAIFLEQQEDGKVKISVVSFSSVFRDYAAEKVFKGLENKI